MISLKKIIPLFILFTGFYSNADVSILACKATKIYDTGVLPSEVFNLGEYSNVDIAVDDVDQARVWFGTSSYKLNDEAASQVEATLRELTYTVDPYGNDFLFKVSKNMLTKKGQLFFGSRNTDTELILVAELNCNLSSSVMGSN